MNEEYVPQTGDIVTILPNPTFFGKAIPSDSTIFKVPNDYKWVVKVFPPMLHFGIKEMTFALYPLLDRQCEMNEGFILDPASMNLVYRVENPEGV